MKKCKISIGMKYLCANILAILVCFSSVAFAAITIYHENVQIEQDGEWLQDTASAIVVDESLSFGNGVELVLPSNSGYNNGDVILDAAITYNGSTIVNPVFSVIDSNGNEVRIASFSSIYYTKTDRWFNDEERYLIQISQKVEGGTLVVSGLDENGLPVKVELGSIGAGSNPSGDEYDIQVEEETTRQEEPGLLRTIWNWITEPFEEAARMIEEIVVELLLRLGDGILYLITASVGETVTIDRLVFNGVGKVNINYWDGIAPGSKDVKATMAKVVVPWYELFYKISVIVYIIVLIVVGIQVLLNSTAEKKAKYKEVLVSWVVGVMMLTLFPFVLKYVVTLNEVAVNMMCVYLNGAPMSQKYVPEILEKTTTEAMATFGTAEFVDYMMEENLVVNSVVILENVTDSMLQIRLQAQFKTKIVLVIIYFIMLGQMIVLLFMYYKRAFMLAFLITIFPLVAMTYAIDKIGDKKAQSFEIWFKEYLVNVIVQIFHAIVYVVIVSSSVNSYMSDGGASWLFMIISVLFLFQGEKILRNIFGIKSSANTIADLAATGAAIYGVRKIFGSGGKDKNIGSAQDNADMKTVSARMSQRPDTGAQSAEAREAAARNNPGNGGGGGGGGTSPQSPAGSYTGNDPAGVDTAGFNATAAQDTVIQRAMARRIGRGIGSGAVNLAGKVVGATAGATYGLSKGDTASGSAIGEAIQGGAAGGMIGAAVTKPAEAIVNKAEQAVHGERMAHQIEQGEMDRNLGLNMPAGMAMPGNIDPNEIVGKHGETMQEIYRKALAEMARATARKGKARGEMAFWNYIEENMDNSNN